MAREIASDTFEIYSAGNEPSYTVDDRTAWMLLEYCSYDITEGQPTHVSELPEVDIVINLGSENDFSNISCSYSESWGLTNPKGQGDDAYRAMIEEIRKRIYRLREEVIEGAISIN